MSLKTDFFDGATGLHSKMNAARDAGTAFVTTNMVALSNALKTNAAQGITAFTVSLTTSDNPTYLRGNSGENFYRKSYFDGIMSGLLAQDLYTYEVTLSLNTTDTVITSVNFIFNFETT